DLAEGGDIPGIDLTHGSTVATNALLTRIGARTALITTEGFEDVIEIGRQNRKTLYDLAYHRPAPLVPRRLRFGVSERLDERGRVVSSLRRR
ncbi:MAG: hydantoinase/oxoprolinase N-terminal domain-containing protein, partial [Planctomycetota bacterium]|nr:hydantoinase/oxoprolinase N-terminal domain-containing protein [Planctomycetota bacterium]